jgi:hypothetical protein
MVRRGHPITPQAAPREHRASARPGWRP